MFRSPLRMYTVLHAPIQLQIARRNLLHICSTKKGNNACQSTSTSLGLAVRSVEHPNVLSEKINFSAPGGPKSAKFDPEHRDPVNFEVGNFSAPPDRRPPLYV